jgi:hypothetical protein
VGKKKSGKQQTTRHQASARDRAAAMVLVRDPSFLFRVMQQIGRAGIVGEKRNRLTLFLAALTRGFEKVVSVIVKGPTSSGKNNLVRAVVGLLPPEWVIVRSSLTKKALAYGEESLAGKILYLHEYRGGRDAQLLTRLLQSEGVLHHEHTVIRRGSRTTEVAHREGDPVMLTTCTDEKVYDDDETRFLSARVDASASQTRSVLRSQFQRRVPEADPILVSVWQEACRIVSREQIELTYPDWYQRIGELIPSGEPRARRDAGRFQSLLEVITRCRSFSDGRRDKGKQIEVSLADYAVAYEILADVFASTYRGVHPQAVKVADNVARLPHKLGHPVTATGVAKDLKWSDALTYKWLHVAVKEKLVAFQEGSQPRNQKYLIPVQGASLRFLPHPVLLLNAADKSAGDEVRYNDPLTGTESLLRRRR